MKILLADDDAVSRILLQRTLERGGFKVLCVEDGHAAAAALLADDGPRMAILDWEMPLQDGPSVCREVRAAGSSAYLILLTSREAVEDIVTGFDAGADDYLIHPCNPDELKARIRVGTRSLQLQASLMHEAQHDPLTGLPNRACFVKRLAHNVRRAREHPGYNFALLFVDIDRFKVINDSLGHLIGDELMKSIAQRLLQAVRFESPPPGHSAPRDLVARIGGDEFVILLENCAGLDNGVDAGVRVAQRIQTVLKQAFFLENHEVFVTASIGISTGSDATDASEVLRSADAAMYKAKRLGKARFEVNDTPPGAPTVNRLQLENDIRRGVENEEFEAFYQPIVSLDDRCIVGFEALVRWRHPQHGLLQPDHFLEIAEDSGLIVPIGAQVTRQACRWMRRWNDSLISPRPLTICINVSPRQFAEDDLVERVQRVLSETGIDPAFLELEITENLTMQDADRAASLLDQINRLGVSISLDDFGTGYSSLNYLLRFPLRTLKVDRSFIYDIENSRERATIVETIISLGHNLGMRVVAEGIENASQMDLLRSLDCDSGQGYFFSHPVPANEAEQLLQRRPIGLIEALHPESQPRPALLMAS